MVHTYTLTIKIHVHIKKYRPIYRDTQMFCP